MKFLKQFSIILFISFLGEILHTLIPLPVPASVYGLVLMLAALVTGTGDGGFFDRDHAGDVHTGRSGTDGILVLSSACLAACDPDHHFNYSPGNGSDRKSNTGNDRKGEKR